MKKITLVLGMFLALAACADEDTPPPAPVGHSLPPKIMMNVKRISLTDRSVRQPLDSPYIDNHFSPTISEAITQWAGDRLQAVGQSGQAIIVIKEASLTSQVLTTSDSLDMWFTRQQGLRYTGHAEVSIEATADPGFAIAEAAATRSVTLPEHPSAKERQDAYYSLLNGLMRDLGQNLEASVQSHMGSFIVSAPVYGVTSVPSSGVYGGTVAAQPVIVQSPYSSSMGEPQNLVAAPVQTAPIQSSMMQQAPSVQVAPQQPVVQHVVQPQPTVGDMSGEMPLAGPDQGYPLNMPVDNTPTVVAPSYGQSSSTSWPTNSVQQQTVQQQAMQPSTQPMVQPTTGVVHQPVSIPLSGPYMGQ